MTVKELIIELQSMPKDAQVEVPDWSSDECVFVDFVAWHEDEKTVRIVP